MYQLNDTLNWVKGRHHLLMGGSWQRQRITPYNFGGQYPQVTFGFSGAAPLSVQLTAPSFPGGISATELSNANAMAAWLRCRTRKPILAASTRNRFEAFMDNNNRQLGVGRSLYHQTHVVNGQAIYQLPFGEGRRWLNKPGWLNGLVGDWQVASILALQSGSPLTIYSGRGTVNRGGRSNCAAVQICNTAFTSKSVEEIRDLLGIYKLADGRIFWINPDVVDPATGRGVGVDNAANASTFAGQIFFNPVAGQPGNLPVLAFDGPPQFRLDLAVSKRVRFDRYGLEFKAEAFNLTNNVSFFRSDMDINSTTFGRLTSANVDSRIWQFSARVDF